MIRFLSSYKILLLFSALLFIQSIGCETKPQPHSDQDQRLKRLLFNDNKSKTELISDDSKKCDSRNLSACVNLGILLSKNKSDEEQMKLAREKFQLACDGDYGPGCWYFGNSLKHGRGGPIDVPQALRVYTKGCQLDHHNSCVALAFANAYGQGVIKDLDKAIELFDKACQLGTACEHAKHFRKIRQKKPAIEN